MITVFGLDLKSGPKQILQNINLTIQPGRVTSILGPNGAGKTSLLRCLSGDAIRYTGEIRLRERPLKHYSLAELARLRAVLSQANPVTFPFTALEIVMLGRNPYLSENNLKRDTDIAGHALNAVDAWQFKDRLFPTLSGGEQQRVQLARVLAQIWEQREAILFLDEPTAALDLKHQHEILALARRLAAEKAMTVICILHDIHLAQHYSTEAILMRAGAIYQAGASDQALSAANIQHIYQLPDQVMAKFHLSH